MVFLRAQPKAKIMNTKSILPLFLASFLMACTNEPTVTEWVSSTIDNQWQLQQLDGISEIATSNTVIIDTAHTAQTMEGFGVCMSELGWLSLSELSDADRDAVLDEMFVPQKGGNFTVVRTPIAASDFATGYYSYNDTPLDFEMKNFSIAHDTVALIPLIKAVQQRLPKVKIWASPWCPPSWMKKNQHYAMRSTLAMERELDAKKDKKTESTYMYHVVRNGLAEDKQGDEGADMFIVEDEYLKAYALYFKKYVQAYRNEGIDIFGVMPQNEFNSAQIFPSCCWLSSTLARFIGDHLGPALEEEGVEVMFGTMERADAAMVDTVLTHPTASKYVKRVGYQWAGRKALPDAYEKWYPKGIQLMMTEQECGNGKNDLAGAMHSWELMKHYLSYGVSIYEYWNISLMSDCVSHWGWRQNSLVVVNEKDKTYRFTPEYYVLKHASHYVMPGARRLILDGTYDDVLAFINPDKSIAVIVANSTKDTTSVTITLSNRNYTVMLKPLSMNTLTLNSDQSL